MKDDKDIGGRPTIFKEEYIEQVYKLCLLGATDKEIADFFNVCESTINNWKIVYPMFLESIKKGKIFADANVAEKLYNRACGYEHEEVKLAQMEGVFTDEKTIIKHYAPDPTAAIFWLKNRQPSKFRDKQEIENTGEVKYTIVKADKKIEEL